MSLLLTLKSRPPYTEGRTKESFYSPMQRKDYYEILGVTRDADPGEIKIAYRRLALRNHPDTNRDDPHSEDRFKEINEAYDVLSHPDKRNRYDLGRTPLGGSPPFRASPFADPWSDPFEDFFSSLFRCRSGGFGRGFGHRRRVSRGTGARPADFGPRRADRPVHDLLLTSDEAFTGTERDIRLHTGRGTLVFNVSVPAGIKNGTLLSFRCFLGDRQELELLFRVRIVE